MGKVTGLRVGQGKEKSGRFEPPGWKPARGKHRKISILCFAELIFVVTVQTPRDFALTPSQFLMNAA